MKRRAHKKLWRRHRQDAYKALRRASDADREAIMTAELHAQLPRRSDGRPLGEKP